MCEGRLCLGPMCGSCDRVAYKRLAIRGSKCINILLDICKADVYLGRLSGTCDRVAYKRLAIRGSKCIK